MLSDSANGQGRARHVLRTLVILACDSLVSIALGALLIGRALYGQWPEGHLCNDAQIRAYARAHPTSRAPFLMSVVVEDGSVPLTGSAAILVVKAEYFDHHGACTIRADKLKVTWSPRTPGDEFPFTPTGSRAVFRPTHQAVYDVLVTAEYPPFEPQTKWSRVPAITHEQNAILHLKASLGVVYQYDFRRDHTRPPRALVQACAPLWAAYEALNNDHRIDAAQQLESYRNELVRLHQGNPTWARFIAEMNDVIEGIRTDDHRFDSLPYVSGLNY
jgi:hypothetical protein